MNMKNGDLKTLLTASLTIILSLVLLIGGIYAVPKLVTWVRNQELKNDHAEPTRSPSDKLIPLGDVKITEVDIKNSLYITTTLSNAFKVGVSDKVTKVDVTAADLNEKIEESDIKTPSYLPEGYYCADRNVNALGTRITTRYSSDTKGRLDLTYFQSRQSAVHFYLDLYASDDKLYTVEHDDFFGVVLETQSPLFDRLEGWHRFLYIHDGEFLYCVSGIGFEIDELVCVALSLNLSKSDKVQFKEKKDAGLSDNFKNYPVGYFKEFEEYIGIYNLTYDTEAALESSSVYSHYTQGKLNADAELFPECEDYEAYKLSDGEYIYCKDGKAMFKYTMYIGHSRHKIRFSGNDVAFYTAKVGENDALLMINGRSEPVLYWHDTENVYSLVSYCDKVDSEELLTLARSCKSGEVPRNEYKNAYSYIYTKDAKEDERSLKIEQIFIDMGDKLYFCGKNDSNYGIWVHLYDNTEEIPRSTIDETGNCVYETVISKEALKISECLMIGVGDIIKINYTYDGENITIISEEIE